MIHRGRPSLTRSHHSKPGRRGPGIALGALLALALAALAPAAADARPPRISEHPAVAGTPAVGATVEASGAKWDGSPAPTASWQWLRCPGDSRGRDDCRSIAGATATAYTVTEADLGSRLRVLLVVRNEDGWSWALSAESAKVGPTPGPQPSPSPGPLVAPSPSPSPSPSPAPAPAVPAPERVDVLDEAAAQPPRMMRPAPLVRIRGRLTRSGARITLLTVLAPRGARITVRCIGRGCPVRRIARTASVTRLTRFERSLPAGTRLIVTVTKRRRIGKHTTIAIRRGKAPTRRDRCLMPGARKPVACPAA
jgi:hypothetical protein